MTCAACSTAVKDWNGSDRKCAFSDGLAFSSDNWMCATVQLLRELFWTEGPGAHSRLPYTVNTTFSDDQWTASINLAQAELPDGGARTLWISWYKSRGRTEALWLLSEDSPPRLPTEADILTISQYLKDTAK